MDLLVVFKLLQRKNVLVEIFLKLLVCIVDVKLLKAVHLCEGTRESRKAGNLSSALSTIKIKVKIFT